jgi:peptidoglycan/LPS O-acetylase OafA/YrhL
LTYRDLCDPAGRAGPAGIHALPSCVGAALLIAGNGVGAGWRGNPIGRLLGQSAAVYLGLISYSLYLWHWPILCGVHLVTGGQPSAAVLVLAVLASLAAAALSYHAIELPVRQVDERGQFRFRDMPLVLTCGLSPLAIVSSGRAPV